MAVRERVSCIIEVTRRRGLDGGGGGESQTEEDVITAKLHSGGEGARHGVNLLLESYSKIE
jgi:hypothetical protein